MLFQEEIIEGTNQLTKIYQLQKNASQIGHLGHIGFNYWMARFVLLTYLYVGYWGI